MKVGSENELCMRHEDPAITAALSALAPEGVAVAHKIIAEGDENALLEEEAAAFERSALNLRRQSGAARRVAREILHGWGLAAPPLPRASDGPPQWPPGVVGSLAHDESIAVAALARAEAFRGVGVDVEPAAPLPAELIEQVATPRERGRYAATILESRVLFAAKEAVYKAQFSCDSAFLDFHDIDVDLESNRAVTRTGRAVWVRVLSAPRILALALIAR